MTDRSSPTLDPTDHPADGARVRHAAQSRIAGPIPLVVEPVRRPIMVQRWADVVFLHWRFEPNVVQRLLPPGVTVDTFDDSAWVGLVPFRMERLRLPGLPPFPVLGTFPEVNVRTYVTSGDRRGVWFCSLDIDKLLPTAVARLGYRLPYCYGRAGHDRTPGPEGRLRSRVERRWPRPAAPEAAAIEVAVGDDPPDGDTDLHTFLTSRWGLIAASPRGVVRYAPVDHPDWDLRRARLVDLDENLVRAAGLPDPEGPPHVMWSPGTDVRIGLPRRVDGRVGRR